MKQRERLLAALFGLGILSLVAYLALDRLFLAPAAECEVQIQEVDLKINEQLALKARQPAQEAHLKDLAAQSFGEDDNRVGQRVRTVITDLLGLSGLSTQTLSLRLVPGGRAPNAYHEVVCQIQARGKLEPMVNFLFLMAQESHLHRMDNMVLQPVGGSPGEVTLQVRYATLVLDPAKGEKLVLDAAPKTVLDESTLESPERAPYDMIVARDLFRPYIPREPAVAVRPNPGGGGGSVEPPPTRTSSPPSERINDLSLYLGQSVVGLTNSDKYYKVGDELAGGKIVCVDYRPLPMPKDPKTLSMSRVIIRIGTDYYAVELGQSLAEKRVLPPAQLPPDLPKLQTVDPGPAPAPGAAAPK